jgi:hypothetical protein
MDSLTRALSAILTSTILLASSATAGEEAAKGQSSTVIEVRVTTKKGATFTGNVPSDSAIAKAFGDESRIEGDRLAPDLSFRLADVNGLSGSMGLRATEISTVDKLGEVDVDALGERRKQVAVVREQKWEKERLRLEQLNADRKARAVAAAEAEAAAAAAAAEAALKLAPEHQQWIDKYPPADGWVPALKQQIYHQTIILNNRAPSEQEKAWLADYDAWKVAYDAWRAIEVEKAAREEKAKAEGKPLPAGADKPDPSGTAGSTGGSIDPAAPSAEDGAILPPKLKPDVKAPVAIKKHIPPPSDLEPGVAKPVGLKNGTEP